jgi:hypothetical protein
VSERAFRYFHNKYKSLTDKPLVALRRTLIHSVKPYKCSKESYLKKGSRAAQSGLESKLFDHMFELILNEDYEKNF